MRKRSKIDLSAFQSLKVLSLLSVLLGPGIVVGVTFYLGLYPGIGPNSVRVSQGNPREVLDVETMGLLSLTRDEFLGSVGVNRGVQSGGTNESADSARPSPPTLLLVN